MQPYFVLIILLSLACSTKKNPVPIPTYRDSVVRAYLEYSAQRPFYDTTDYRYELLQAHVNNDTAFLKGVIAAIESSKHAGDEGFPDSIRRHPVLKNMPVDVAYQISYGEVFCNLSFYFTIAHYNDSISLHSVIYKGHENPPFLTVIKESNTVLSASQWDEFEQLIRYTDFWGLMRYKESIGFDGNSLDAEGVIRDRDHRIRDHKEVHRRFVRGTALYSAYLLLAKFAHFKNRCD